ncbi:alpha/beta hydrolase (plasmid) [Rhizobium sullae]|uniref:Alpha/beta hydrolase n=1 Tax=Rhizobium sullae TaxID=50338 RepID=A0A2N0DFJ5_RHISU|nr:alpha/beta hydrolase [Rhizobium sullae]PKA44868.1 alpha/beta hydrolase [Rhizobium sullae]UWU17617.1 alpha/beta hydrolase [Rhizobium sullae]
MQRLAVYCATIAATFGAVPALAEVERKDFRINAAPGIELAIREVQNTGPKRNGSPIVLVHGARVPGIASFDLPVEGGSLAAELATRGYRVFIVDARGYGGSDRPGQDGPQEGRPLTHSNEVARDIDAVVEAIRDRTGSRQVSLLGWATGGHWAGMYASLFPEKVSHLVIYNSLYGATSGHPTLGADSENADPNDRRRFNVAKFGAYRLNTAASLMPSWDKSIPAEDKQSWRDPAVVEAYQHAALASDPIADDREPAVFRSPSGAMEDSFYLASGRQLWDAASITARVLIIRSENDFWSRPDDVKMLEGHLVNAARARSVTIPDATHYVHLDRSERGRSQFIAEVVSFLSESVNTASP